MLYGSKPSDGGHLILNENEKKQFIINHPEAAKFIKKFVISLKSFLTTSIDIAFG
jgi:hypothetical protein